MNNEYKHLFIEIAKSAELLAEQVMEYDHLQQDTEGEKTAAIMRTDFQQLQKQIESNEPAKNDYIKLLVGAMIIKNNLQTKVEQFQKAITGYEMDVIPKLQRIMDETFDDESARELATEIFQ